MTKFESTYPYPPRASELVKNFSSDVFTPKVNLTEGERNQILQFEEPIFNKLKEVKKTPIGDHVIYPAAFTTEQGKKIFAAIYLDPDINKKVEKFAESEGITDWKVEKDKRKTYDKFFDNLPLEDDALPRMGDVTVADIEKLFAEVDLTRVPERLADRINTYSSKWAEEEFKKSFLASKGIVDNIENPRRIKRVTNPVDLKKKVEGFRKLKKTVKDIRTYLEKDKGVLVEAKKQVCSLYQRYLNVLIAEFLSYERAPEDANRSRQLERVDHFLNGVGLRYGTNGLLETIPEDLSKYCEQRLKEPLVYESPEFVKYNAHQVNADQAKFLADKILEAYGLLNASNAWKAVVLERKTGLGVMFDKKSNTREIRIPRDYKRGIVTTLALLSHEIEGHVLRYVNKENAFKEDLLFTQDFGTGRSGILSEGAAMWLEDEAKQEMVGMKDPALPYYYVALREKQRGGSFKECVKASYDVRMKREPGANPSKTLDKAYSSVQRIFRRFTNYDDKGGYLPISETLDYIEQEIVVDFLMNHSNSQMLSKLLFVAGIDLYSIGEMMQIGFLNLDKVQEPRRIATKQIWPKIKESLDQGNSIEKALL